MRQTYVWVDISQYMNNLKAIRGSLSPRVKLMAVVKADAYGHGLVPVARAAQQAGADYLGVAIAEEGILLRQAEVSLPILVLSGLQIEGMLEAVRYGLTLCCFTQKHILNAAAIASSLGVSAKLHIKFDTGMNRVGVRDKTELQEILTLISSFPHLSLEGAFTHFSCADSPDSTFTDAQLDRFLALSSLLPNGLLLHAANSAALLSRKDCQFGMVRAGICSYGYPPVPTDLPLKPVLSWKAEVNHVKEIDTGDAVSYGAQFIASQSMRIATLAVGYGDGFLRAFSGKASVLLNGIRCPVLGRVCMDQIMVDVSRVGMVQVGDSAVLIGCDDNSCISADELAKLADTISYEVLLSISTRVPRIYK